MKKYIFLFVIITILALGSSVNAESLFAEVSGDKVLMRNTASDGSVEIKSVEIYNLEDYRYFGIRNMSEGIGAELSWDDTTKTVLVTHGNLVISLKNNSSEIFINGSKYDFGYPVIIIEGKSFAPLELYKAFTGELKLGTSSKPSENTVSNSSGLSVETSDNADRITLYGASSGIIENFILTNPSRLVIDIADVNITGTYTNGATYNKIRHFKGSDGITRVVFDLKQAFKYNIDFEGSDVVLTISENGLFAQDQDFIEFRNNSVIINTGEYSGYKIFRTTDPFTIKAEFPKLLTDTPFIIDIGGEYVNSIAAELNGSNTIITVELKEQCSFELEKLKETFIIGIYEPAVHGVIYHKNNDLQFVSLDFLKNIDAVTEISNRKDEIVIKIQDPQNTISSGQVYINDESIKSIFVSRSGDTVTLKITTKATRFAEAMINDGIVRLNLTENDYSEFLVVISPGHGGSDPGAIVNGLYESHLNLDISEKLREKLENAGVRVYMMRTDDTFVSLEYRTQKANNLHADLFISIHNNTLENPEFDGLMTLVHSGRINYDKINGKTAGTIIHEEVIAATGATDRGVRDRDKIIVLKDTAMPAVEIECGFLTNQTEFGKLLEDSYQWSIAEGTARGILKVLDLMD